MWIYGKNMGQAPYWSEPEWTTYRKLAAGTLKFGPAYALAVSAAFVP